MEKSLSNNSGKIMGHENKNIPKKVKDKLKPLVQKLLKMCSDSKVLTNRTQLDDMKEIFEILEKIQGIEKDFRVSFPDRKKNWNQFYDWCSENGADFSSVEVKEIAEGNFGVIAKKDIKIDEPFLKIPRKIMMSEISAKNSRLGPLISSDPILQNMPNIQVAMHLLTEFLDPKSFWQPYIAILPSSFSTVLYFTEAEISELQRSPVKDEVFKILRSVIRQYCYFFLLFQRDAYAKSLNIGQYFTYDLYRWAVSCTMTRQNVLPSDDGMQKITSLVPLFDMCNHSNGKLYTDFNLESDSLISYSFKPFAKDNEVFMFYGARTNAEFMVHNAFVYPENENDCVEIKLGYSTSDPSSSKRIEWCTWMKIPPKGPFYLYKVDPVREDLLKFLIINVMTTDDLNHIENLKDNNIDLMSEDYSVLQKKAFLFLKTRIHLLIQSYPTTLKEDEDLLTKAPNPPCQLLAVQLRICEKQILFNTYKYCSEKVD